MTALDLKLGPQDELLLRWDGEVWHANYQKRLTPRPSPPIVGFTEVKFARGAKIGIPGEGAEEVARGAIFAAQLNEVR